MNDMEQRLRNLGDETREEAATPPPLSSRVRRRIRIRRLGSGMLALAVVAGLIVGGTYAVSALTKDRGLAFAPAAGGSPADEGVVLSAFSGRYRVNIVVASDLGAVCYGFESKSQEGSFDHIAIVSSGTGHATVLQLLPVEPPLVSNVHDCVHYVGDSTLNSLTSRPESYSVELRSGPKRPVVAPLHFSSVIARPSPFDFACHNPVPFDAGYVPTGWLPTLQPGSFTGATNSEIVGHYGPPPQSATKVPAIDVLASTRPLETSGPTIHVLSGVATLHRSTAGGYSVIFSAGGCTYSLGGVIDKGTLIRFAKGLRPSS